MMDKIINCYHNLLKLERKKLKENGDRFSSVSRLEKKEVENVCRSFGLNINDLQKEKLLIKYPDGKFRTLHYDMVFRLVNIRAFETGSRIPLEYRIFQQITYLPNFKEKAVAETNMPKVIKEMLIRTGRETLSNFQFEYIKNILKDEHKSYVISSPTATGKSLIFTIPVILATLKRERAILIYPRKALASDQLSALLEYLEVINENLRREKRYPITVGIDDGDTPKDESRIPYGKEFRGLECPICAKKGASVKLIYSKKDDVPLIKCEKGHSFDYIFVTNKQIRQNPPSILITNCWILNRRLMETQASRLFREPVKYIVLDEAHVYREETGAHIHFVLSRLKRKLKKNTNLEPSIIISSATLPKDTLLDFCSRLLDVEKKKIFWKSYEELTTKGKEKIVIHLILLPNPFRSAEVLAENILLFLIEWSYFSGKKSLFFVDSTHEIHRLRHFAEVIIRRRVKGITRALEHLKSNFDENEPFYWGHYSPTPVTERDSYLIDEFSNILDYHFGGLERSKRSKIEEEYKKGIKRCLLSTSTLELGIDIGDISVVAHYRYPYSGESYIQRIGRAGRSKESYYTTLSILILTNSPSQIKYMYGEETPTLFELPADYIIPLPLENDAIKETHEFLEVLDILSNFNRATLIQTSDIRRLWKGKTYIEVFKEIEEILKDGISVKPDRKRLLQLYLERLRHRKDLIELGKEEIPFPFKFKEKLDWLKELEEWATKKLEEIKKIFGEYSPLVIKKFLMEISNRTSLINIDIEHVYKHYKAGDRESFEKVSRRIENQSKDLKKFFLNKMDEIDKSLLSFWYELMNKGAPLSQRDFVKKLIGEFPRIREIMENIEITYRELLGYFLNIKWEIETLLKPTMYWRFNLVEALNLLGIPNYHISLLFEKPLPKIYVNYPGLPQPAREYMERTIDQLLWICTPFRVTPIQDYFFTIIYGLPENNYKIKGYRDYVAFEGGDQFTFRHLDKRYTAWTPHFINMLNLNTSVIEALSDSFGGSQNCKLILGNRKRGYPDHNLENCRICLHGFLISTEQRDICTRTRADCSLYPNCGGKKWFFKPKPPLRTSYLGLVKVYPQIYTNAKKFEHEILVIPISQELTIKLGKGSLFDRALVGCSLISTGGLINFFYPPTFTLVHNTLGYRISSNGIIVEFDKEKIKLLLKDILKLQQVYPWLLVKYLITEKYFKERGDVNLELCQKAFEGLIDERRGTKAFGREFKKLLRKKEINDDFLNFAAFVFMHSLAHLLYEYIVEELKTSPDNIIYHIDKNEYKVYLIENAEKGLGLTETLFETIRGNEKEFFIEFLKWCLRVVKDCELHKVHLKELASQELSEKIKYLEEEDKKIFYEIDSFVKKVNKLAQTEYGIEFPIEILRNILVRRFGNNPLIMEAIVSNASYCWDGCYNCVRLYRGCNYDPFKQMTRVSKTLLYEVIKKILNNLNVPIEVGRGFGWILDEIEKTRKILRISSPWISKDIVVRYIEPLLKKDIQVKIITRKDLENIEQIETLKYLTDLERKYQNIEVKYLDTLHAKMILVDDKIGIKGSVNLTYSGIFKNVELVEKYTEEDVIQKLVYEFEKIFNMAARN